MTSSSPNDLPWYAAVVWLALSACGEGTTQPTDVAHTPDASQDTADATANDAEPQHDMGTDVGSEVSFGSPGPFAAGGLHTEWTDAARDRTLPITIWYPTAATDGRTLPYFRNLLRDGTALADVPIAPGERFPVIVFSHGNSGFRSQSYFLTEHLATHGYVVIAPDHVDNTATTYDEDLWLDITLDRPLDVSAAIDAAFAWNDDSEHPLFGALNLEAIGSVGHSFGGFTQFAVAGAAFDSFAMAEACAARGESAWGGKWSFCARIPDASTERAEACRPCALGDARVSAFVAMAPAYADFFVEGGLEAIARPMLIMAGSADEPWSPTYARDGFFDAIAAPDRVLWSLQNGGHYSFSIACDIPALQSLDLFECTDDIIDPQAGFVLIQEAVTAYLARHLRNDAAAMRVFDAPAACRPEIAVETPTGTPDCP